MLKTLLISATLLLAATPAAAETGRTLGLVRVPVGDLDLATSGGAVTMMRRLNLAAAELCAPLRSPIFPREEGRAYHCRKAAIGAAVEQLRSPPLRLAYLRQFPSAR
jgi:UrcA family protein